MAPCGVPAAGNEAVNEEKEKTEYQRFENESEFNAALERFLEHPGNTAEAVITGTLYLIHSN